MLAYYPSPWQPLVIFLYDPSKGQFWPWKGQKMPIFSYIPNCATSYLSINLGADKGGGGQNIQKICGRHKWMAP